MNVLSTASRRIAYAAVLLSAAITLAGCGGGSGSGAAPPAPTPVVTASPRGTSSPTPAPTPTPTATATPTPTAASTSAPEQTGLYLYIAHPDLPQFDAQYTPALAQPYIDGAAIMLQWQELEPQPGTYDFAYLDTWMQPALAMHKTLSLGVIAGIFTPSWLYGPGYDVPANTFQYDRTQTGSGGCTSITQPTFWNATYLQQYGNMLQALATHLRTYQGPGVAAGSAYQATRLIKLSGINNTTEELRIDASGPSFEACQTDAVAAYAAAGFTPDKTVAAFSTIAAETAAAFPDQILSLAIIHRDAFPPIDDSGNVSTTITAPDALTASILNATIPTYGHKLLVQWDALYNNGTVPEVIAAGQAGARIGWQMNGFEGTQGGSGCVYDPPFEITACKTVADFQSILDTGIETRGYYLEVQAGSVDNPEWTPAFQEGRARLTAATTGLPY